MNTLAILVTAGIAIGDILLIYLVYSKTCKNRKLTDQLAHLTITLLEDRRWLAHDPTAKALTERYLSLTSENWGSIDVESIPKFRDSIGLNPYKKD